MSSNTNTDNHANANQQFSWTDTLSIAFASCSAASSSCFPSSCLRRVPSDDSIQNEGGVGGGINRMDVPTNPFNPAINRIPRARPDELQGLLADAYSDNDTDAERLSLHSNFGRNRPSRKKKKPKKISLFGFDLFGAGKGKGKKAPPIHLGDEDDALYGNIDADDASSSTTTTTDVTGPVKQKRRRDSRAARPNASSDTLSAPLLTASTSMATFDSDAAPLPSSVIEELSSSTSAAALIAAAEAEAQAFKQQQAEKEARSQRKRERRAQRELRERLERERLALERFKMQGVLPESGNGEEFEGFQGSGSAVPPSMGALLARRSGAPGTGTTTGTSTSTSTSTSQTGSGSRHERLGSVVQAAPVAEPTTPEADEEEAADLGGEMYSSKRRPYGSKSSNGSDSRSRTSRTSASFSQSGQGPLLPTNTQQLSSLPPSPLTTSPPISNSQYPQPSPLQSAFTTPAPNTPALEKPKKKKKKHGQVSISSTARSHSTTRTSTSNASTSQSTSLASPTSTGFGMAHPHTLVPEDGDYLQIVSPSTIEQGLGFFDADDLPSVPSPAAATFDKAARRHDFDGTVGGDFDGTVGGGFDHAPMKQDVAQTRDSSRRGDFPMAGFGLGGGGRKARDMAKFLANTGDQDLDGAGGL
ncbi:hypothetical protein CC1G_09210 [Coprinopsis cinerea okayama7|uniref:Uncharacterized protein n=1 Tax=Coprinopsis cinerea (strain Okayama-7 / 130 / ATCC MYA-4618 / FGSC 9003) TaxID=240176 RepID=A8P4X6_COPC7|nr:hypothetical protein CC1G_09210 [Coprinopsis cinerea okayama7\|eukprot:XP_001838833.2 hypothetical protein CC1G_09210 [Coprinopsis cinerea okayama7\